MCSSHPPTPRPGFGLSVENKAIKCLGEFKDSAEDRYVCTWVIITTCINTGIELSVILQDYRDKRTTELEAE